MGLTTPDYKQYLIRKTTAKQRPTNIIYLDTETRQVEEDGIIKHRMKMAWLCHCRLVAKDRKDAEKWLFWQDPLMMQKYIEKATYAKQVLYIFAHNVYFDLQSSDFFYYFTKAGWLLDFIYDKGLVYILSIRKGNKRIKCISTTNYFPVTLKALGETVGLEKLDVDFEQSTDEEIKTYCYRDVEIIKAAMEKYIAFIDKHDLGSFTSTKSSQAFTAFRHRFMDHKIFAHRDEDLSAFEKEAYYGGRVECSEIGEIKNGPFVSLDVNSMYSYVMRRYGYPVKIIDLLDNPSPAQVKMCLRRYCVIGDVYLDTDEPAYAYRQGGKVIFPIGRFPTFLCTGGLDYALANNHLIKVKKLAVYDKAHVFVSYVDYLYELKNHYEKQNDKTMRTLCKYLLNSLYGKFGQKQPLIEEEEDYTCTGYSREEILDLVTGKTEIITKLFNKTLIAWGEKIGNNSLIAIASHVTEYARFYIYEMMRAVGIKNVLYTDTDSLKIRKKHEHKLSEYIDNERLGGLKVEENFNLFTIHGPKDYATENFTKIKGVPKKAELQPDGRYKYTAFLKQDSHLRKQITRYFITRVTFKELKREYTKGIVLPNGKVKPFKLAVSDPDPCL